jgi:putative iron-dependent peroxidase
MNSSQPGILEPIPAHAKYLFYDQIPGGNAAESLQRLADFADGTEIVVGLGQSLTLKFGVEIPGLRCFPAQCSADIDIPSTSAALLCWLRGNDRGELLHRSRQLNALLADSFLARDCIDAFRFGAGRDLTGYEDGTENPTGKEALAAAFLNDAGPGLDGSSFMATQQWLHDFDAFSALTTTEADNSIGRRLSDNVELEDAPASAHVKRTAQESFTPEAFMLRRSMPWSVPEDEGGLFFVAFGKSFYAFEAQIARMTGKEDGIPDALFQYSRPIGGSYFWCPPMDEDRLDFRALKL